MHISAWTRCPLRLAFIRARPTNFNWCGSKKAARRIWALCCRQYRSPRPRPRAGASHGRGPAQQVSGRPPLWRVAAEEGRVPAVEAALPAGPQRAAGAGGAGAAARAARSRQLEADQGAFTTHQGAPPTLCPRVHALPRTSPRALTPGRAWASLRARASSPRSRRGAPGPSSSGSGRRRMCS